MLFLRNTILVFHATSNPAHVPSRRVSILCYASTGAVFIFRIGHIVRQSSKNRSILCSRPDAKNRPLFRILPHPSPIREMKKSSYSLYTSRLPCCSVQRVCISLLHTSVEVIELYLRFRSSFSSPPLLRNAFCCFTACWVYMYTRDGKGNPYETAGTKDTTLGTCSAEGVVSPFYYG